MSAGITFSIWGTIYLLFAGYCVAQFLFAYRDIALRINLLFIISCAFNALWILAWQTKHFAQAQDVALPKVP